MDKSNDKKSLKIGYYTIALAAAWTLIVGASLLWNLGFHRKEILEVARTVARSHFEKDVLYRRWNAMHGGVYAPVTKKTPPNYYLSFAFTKIKEREIRTSSGRLLTLINPAYMTRQVHELGKDRLKIKGHLTSLKPIRPANVADEWETEALKAFEKGEKEFSSVEQFYGEDHMRLMRPLVTEEGCLKCHAAQGYKAGDIRGGISVSVPLAPLWVATSPHVITIWLGHIVLWVMVIVGIGAGYLGLRKRIRERDQMEGALRQSEEQLSVILHSIQNGIVIIDPETHRIVSANPAAINMIGAPTQNIVGKICHRYICPAEEGQCPITDLGEVVDYSERVLVDADGREIPIIKSVVTVEVGDKQYLVESFVDISERKQMEEEKLKKERLKGVVEMAGAACHELNQPLQIISGLSQLMEMNMSEDDPLLEKVSTLRKQTDRMGEITRKIMSITRYETREYIIEGRPIIDIDKSSKKVY